MFVSRRISDHIIIMNVIIYTYISYLLPLQNFIKSKYLIYLLIYSMHYLLNCK